MTTPDPQGVVNPVPRENDPLLQGPTEPMPADKETHDESELDSLVGDPVSDNWLYNEE